MSKIDDLKNQFKLPICYNDKKHELSKTMVNDLELTKTINEGETPIYNSVFTPSHCFGEIMLESFSKYYTTDVDFLKDTQNMLKKNENNTHNKEFDPHDFQKILDTWNEIKGETGFCEKYLYIDWEFGKFLNNNPSFLQGMSIYNIASPLLSLFMPIFILIVPFFILRIKGIPLKMAEYIEILKLIMSNHAIGKIFTSFNEVDNQQKIYLFISAAFYIFSIYQNILICIRFYSNTKKIHDYLFLFKNYLKHTLHSMDEHLTITEPLESYKSFNEDIRKHKEILSQFKKKLEKITPFQISMRKMTEIGHILQCFYQLYDNKVYNDSILYSFGYHGYIDNIEGLGKHISQKHLAYTKFYKKQSKNTNKNKNKNTNKNKNVFKKAYYPDLISKTPIKNNCNLKSNLIMTGPNASGKTTFLKTILINTLLSQQFGCGCYESAKIQPYDFIHCYLNIPDTSGRDSLFQAEARRCKEIIDSIQEHQEETHFCVFDELYSGTNPEEATLSSIAFMEYLVKHNNVSSILTTHYLKMCEQLENNSRIKNFHMKTLEKDGTFDYTYLIREGISSMKGGIQVLTDMNYPSEIIAKTRNK